MNTKGNHLSAIHLAVLMSFTVWIIAGCSSTSNTETERPNILILMSDNHSWNHLGCYGDPVLKTPVIDKVASQGILFNNVFCAAPSCTPARAGFVTGQDIWRLEEGANLHGILPAKFEVFTDLLEESGYQIGYEGKGWGPGNFKESGRSRNPAGNKYKTIEGFFKEREEDKPYFYWISTRDPHRPYRLSIENAEIDLDKIEVPPYLADCQSSRLDIAGYYAEVQNFDSLCGSYINKVKELEGLENTIVIVTSDNGWQMPRGLANLYLMGTKVPLIISMPEQYKSGREVDDFVNLNDLAPTFLELAGAEIPKAMTGKSIVDILESRKSGMIDKKRDFVVTARERHAYVRKNGAGYGGRAIQTNDFLYIKNYDTESWPAGDPPLYGDVDAHMLEYECPAKMHLLINKDDEDIKPLFDLAFSKRPAEELYDLKADPYQLNNVADDPVYAEQKEKINHRLISYLKETGDPRETGGEMKWLGAQYFATRDFNPRPCQEAIDTLGLEEVYYYND